MTSRINPGEIPEFLDKLDTLFGHSWEEFEYYHENIRCSLCGLQVWKLNKLHREALRLRDIDIIRCDYTKNFIPQKKIPAQNKVIESDVGVCTVCFGRWTKEDGCSNSKCPEIVYRWL